MHPRVGTGQSQSYPLLEAPTASCSSAREEKGLAATQAKQLADFHHAA